MSNTGIPITIHYTTVVWITADGNSFNGQPQHAHLSNIWELMTSLMKNVSISITVYSSPIGGMRGGVDSQEVAIMKLIILNAMVYDKRK